MIPEITLWKIENSISIFDSLMSLDKLEGRSSITIQQFGGVIHAPRPDESEKADRIDLRTLYNIGMSYFAHQFCFFSEHILSFALLRM